jgi:hypothetical protein
MSNGPTESNGAADGSVPVSLAGQLGAESAASIHCFTI